MVGSQRPPCGHASVCVCVCVRERERERESRTTHDGRVLSHHETGLSHGLLPGPLPARVRGLEAAAGNSGSYYFLTTTTFKQC